MLKPHLFARTILLGSVLAASVTSGFAQATEEQKDKPLYDRLGGVYPISVVVEQFVNLSLANDVLNANTAIKAVVDQMPVAGLKYHLTAMVCQQTGGPCKYTGRSMKESHAHLDIGEKEWQAMVADFRRAMNDSGIPVKEQDELVAIIESTKKDIVVTK